MNLKASDLVFCAGCVVLFAQGFSTDTMASSDAPTLNRETAAVEPIDEIPTIPVEISMRDGSVFFCTVKARQLPFTTAYGQKLKIPLQTIQKVVLDQEKKQAVVHFLNSDRLAGILEVESIAVDSLLGSHKVQISNIKSIVIKTQSEKTSAGLVYWCTFESEESIRKPAAGPEGEYYSGVFVSGKIGKALKTNGVKNTVGIDLPAGSFQNKGCIEFWATIDDPHRPFSGGGHPRFFTASTSGGRLWLEYNINNGEGMGGLCALVGDRTCGHPMSYSGSPQPYSSVLKNDPGGWHHYAVVWNDEGLTNIKTLNGEVATFAVLIDGEKYSSRNFEGKPGSFRKMAEGPSRLGIPMPNETVYRDVSFTIDELKIWNYDKTEFEQKKSCP